MSVTAGESFASRSLVWQDKKSADDGQQEQTAQQQKSWVCLGQGQAPGIKPASMVFWALLSMQVLESARHCLPSLLWTHIFAVDTAGVPSSDILRSQMETARKPKALKRCCGHLAME